MTIIPTNPGRFGMIRWCLTTKAGWISVCHRGLHYTSNPPLFSERNGYRSPFLTSGKWRVFALRRVVHIQPISPKP